jgi:outer membrane protein assembly factor BamB
MKHLALLLLIPSLLCGAESWPQWRGPSANGHAGKSSYPSEWNKSKNVAWKSVLPGRGHSSPVHDGKTVWVTTAIETPASEAEKKERLKDNKGLPTVTVLSKVSLRALKIDPKSGKVIQDIEILKKKQPQWVHKLNSYASPTPVIEDGKVYFHFGAYGNACIDAKTGKILWKNEDKALWVMHENGPGSSPLIWDNLMIFHLDGSDKQNIVALYKDSGKIAWKTKRSGELRENPQLQKSYSTPIVETFNGKPVLISCSADWVYGYDPRTGDELWKVKYGHLGFSNVARPVTGHGMIYLSTCFMKAEILAFRYEGEKTPKLAWRLDRGPKMPSPILVGKELYVINDGGILTCVDALTGDLHWRERMDGEFSSSPTYAGGLLYFSDQAGITTVIKPGKTLEVVSKNELDGTAHMASFAPLGKSFLVRTNEALYRIGSL